MNSNNKSEFRILQEELNTIEQNLSVAEYKQEHKEQRQEGINQRLESISKKIDDLTNANIQKLAEQEVITLKNQIERIKLVIGVATKKSLLSLRKSIPFSDVSTTSFADRPPDVQEHIRASAENAKKDLTKMKTEMPWFAGIIERIEPDLA